MTLYSSDPRRLRIVARRRGTGPAVVALREGQEAYVGDALALRARLVQRLGELQRDLASYRSFGEPGADETADRMAAVALAIEELDVLIREDAAAASGERTHAGACPTAGASTPARARASDSRRVTASGQSARPGLARGHPGALPGNRERGRPAGA